MSLAISFDEQLDWDHGLSTVVPTSFVGFDSFDKTRFRFIAGNLSILLWETETGRRGDVLPFHLIKSLIVRKIGKRVRR
jgi:hypothetical protein